MLHGTEIKLNLADLFSRIITLFLLISVKLFSVCAVSSAYGTDDSRMNTYLIPVPDPCVVIERVERGRIHLRSSGSPCIQVISVREVTVIPDENGELEIIHNGKTWKKLKLSNDLENMVENIYSTALQMAATMNSTAGSSLSESDVERLRREVEKTENIMESREFRERVESYRRNLSDLLSIPSSQNDPYGEYQTARGSGLLSPDERIYIFVSENVPIDAVRTFVRDASLLASDHVIFVLRGAIGGLSYIGPTVRWIYSTMVKNPSCVPVEENCQLYRVRFQIDPFLFRRYNITEVPAVVYVRNVRSIPGYSEGLPETETGDSYISTGDASFFYHIYMIGKSSGNSKLEQFAERYLRYQPAKSNN